MYLLKNAWRNMIRAKGRNLLIGFIVTLITISSCIAISIHQSGEALVKSYKESNPLLVSFRLSPMDLRNASDEEKEAFQSLTIDNIKEYANSSYVSDYYYLQETTVSSSTIEAVDYSSIEIERDIPDNDKNDRKNNMQSTGDFRLTAYSDFSYLDDFVSGTKKIIEGSMIEKDNTDYVVVISEDLLTENNLSLGDEIILVSPSDENISVTATIYGVFEDNSDVTTDQFFNMNAMNSRNQIYTNMTTLEIIAPSNSTTSTKQMMSQNGLTIQFVLNDNNDLSLFEEEVREKGLSTYYSITTNETEILANLEHVQNLSSFSLTFLILILIVGGLVLAIIQMINVRDRKYEIGVLRAIGMSKGKVMIQMVSELFFVAIISFFLGTGIGAILNQPVTNQMLANEISANEEKETSMVENFGGDGFSRPGMGSRKDNMENSSNPEYVTTLNVSLDILTIIELLGVCMLLTVTSGMVSVMAVNKYQPNKILQNRI